MQTQVITLCGTLTCVGTAAEWSSSGNGSSLLIDDRLDALPPPFLGVTKLAAPSPSLTG